MRSFVNAFKSIFTSKKTVWVYEPEALVELPHGTKVIDNHGITEMGPCTVYTKVDDDTWSYTFAYSGAKEVLVKSTYLSMPFAVVKD